jgi:hypothetical protein
VLPLFAVIAGALITVFAVRWWPRRRERMDVLRASAVDSGWLQVRAIGVIGVSVSGTWNGHPAKMSIVTDDEGDESFLITEVTAPTRANITIGRKAERPDGWWEKDLFGRSVTPTPLRDPDVDAELEVVTDQPALIAAIFDDTLIVDLLRKTANKGRVVVTPKRVFIRRHLSDLVMSDHDIGRLGQLARRSCDLTARLYEYVAV